jgi:hypothetical protein
MSVPISPRITRAVVSLMPGIVVYRATSGRKGPRAWVKALFDLRDGPLEVIEELGMQL